MGNEESTQTNNKNNFNKSCLNINEDIQQNIIENFFNCEPNISEIALKCSSPEIQKLLSMPNYDYQGKSIIYISQAQAETMSFEEKVDFFRQTLQSLKVNFIEGSECITINRENIVENSMEKFNNIDLYKELKINFEGELSQDAGGIIREWLTILFKELESEKYNLFEPADTKDFSLKLHKNLDYRDKETRNIFFFIGKLLAKCLLEHLTVNTSFNQYIYRIIFNEQITLENLVFIDQKLHSSLSKMKQMDEDTLDSIEAYFCEDDPTTNQPIEYITNGENIKVTKDNIDFFIQSKIKYLADKDRILINEIRKGLISLIPEKLLRIFSIEQFELLINGTPFIDTEDWERHTEYKDYNPGDKTIRNFWEIINSLSQEELGNFLQFCTGSTRVPIGGFASLTSNRSLAPFTIQKTQYSSENKFIRAHTCFNRIDLPDYPTKEELKEKMQYAIIKNTGFQIEE